jgi:carbonic anhydrase
MPEHGPALSHKPCFDYSGAFEGHFYNWGFGPAFTLSHEEGNYTSNPSMTYDNTTVYLIGWHIHTPADHTVAASRARAELHLVHVDAEGKPAAVLGIRMEPGLENSTFVEQLPTPMIHWNVTEAAEEPLEMNLELALDNAGRFDEYWTYEGSLTTPPCSEGIRWFLARRNLFTSMEQMRSILRASRYGARDVQPIWMHNVNA